MVATLTVALPGSARVMAGSGTSGTGGSSRPALAGGGAATSSAGSGPGSPTSAAETLGRGVEVAGRSGSARTGAAAQTNIAVEARTRNARRLSAPMMMTMPLVACVLALIVRAVWLTRP